MLTEEEDEEKLGPRKPSPLPTAVAVASASGTSSSDSQYPGQPDWDACVYRGEGNSNLVVALPTERKVIRLRKSPVGKPSLLTKDHQNVEQQVSREVDFIRRVISCLLGGYVRTPEILLCEPPEIARLAEKIRSERPENRRGKEVIAGYATVYPDYTLLPNHLSNLSTQPTYCVEIKPKQGFLSEADRQLKKCRYCLMQYYKAQEGLVRQRSSYCPYDLFSGSQARMDRALLALLSSSQNNLRIFRDGKLMHNEASESEVLRSILSDWLGSSDWESRFLELLRTALTRPLDDEFEAAVLRGLSSRETSRSLRPPAGYSRLKPELVRRTEELLSTSEECLPPLDVDGLARTSALARILRMQRLHRSGDDVVAWLTANFPLTPTRFDELIYADLLGCTDYDGQPKARSVIDEIQRRRINQSRDRTILDESIDRQSHNVIDDTKRPTCYADIDFSEGNISLDDCIKIVGNYLLHCTARDCSILMAFQKVDGKMTEKISSENVIKLNDDQHFVLAVRILDVDFKSTTRIEKHRQRDNDMLEAVVKTLEKNLSITDVQLRTEV